MRVNITKVGILAVAVLLVGCGDGGSSDGGSTGSAGQAESTASATNAGSTIRVDGTRKAGEDGPSQEPLTRAEMIKEGDLLCKRSSLTIVTELQRHKEDYGRGFSNKPTQKQNEEGIVDIVLPAILRETRYLDKLNPPPADQDEIDAIVKALRDGVKETEGDPGLALEGGPNPLSKAARLSKEYGFKICGN